MLVLVHLRELGSAAGQLQLLVPEAKDAAGRLAWLAATLTSQQLMDFFAVAAGRCRFECGSVAYSEPYSAGHAAALAIGVVLATALVVG